MNLYKLNDLDIEKLLRKEGYSELFIQRNTIKYHYVITLILNKYDRMGRDKSKGFVKIYAKAHEAAVGKYTIKKKGIKDKFLIYLITQQLERWSILKSHKYYNNPRNKVVEYKIMDEWYEKGITLIEQTETCAKFWNRISKHQSKEIKKWNNNIKDFHDSPLYHTHLILSSHLNKIEIDDGKAREWITEATDKTLLKSKRGSKDKRVVDIYMTSYLATYWHMSLDNFSVKRYLISNDGRTHTNPTNLPSPLRQFMHYNGQQFVELDIANSQPLLLALLARNWHKKKGIKYGTDLDRYQDLCESGGFYAYMISELEKRGVKVDTRVFKTDFFARVLFNNDVEKIKYRYRKVFGKLFPSVNKVITELKHNDYKNASYKLRKLEAELIIGKVATTMINSGMGVFFCVHDAIYCLVNDYEKTKKIILEQYANAGLKPSIKIDKTINKGK